jgi:hypothetical protein
MSQGQLPNSGDALRIWKQKLAYLEIEKPKTASASQRFEIIKQIEECEREIHRLESAGFVRHKGTSASTAQAFASPNKRQCWENAPDASRSSSSQTNKSIEIEVFICYSLKDKKMLEQLEISLSSFERENIIKIWHTSKMRGGQRRLFEINKRLNSAHVILLLISRRFMADSELNSQAEMAMQREEAGEAYVIPVLISPVANWKKTRFGGLSPLPKNGKPVNDKSWGNQDSAFCAIAEEFGEIVEELASKQL